MSDREAVPHLRVVVSVTGLTSLAVTGAAGAMWWSERDVRGSNITTYPDALWWAMETVTTVGYGDHHPVTTAGRLVASVLMVLGIALVGVITATVVTWIFTELGLVREFRELGREERREEVALAEIAERLDRIEERLADRTVGSPAGEEP